MEILVTILIVAALAGGVWWNHQNANRAMQGVSFVVPYPPTAVVAAIDRAHNHGAMAVLTGTIAGMSVAAVGPSGFETSSKLGDSGEIAVSRDAAGSMGTARALPLYVGVPPQQLRGRGIWAFSVTIVHGIYTILSVTPGAARMNRWQNGLEGRINKKLAKATN